MIPYAPCPCPLSCALTGQCIRLCQQPARVSASAYQHDQQRHAHERDSSVQPNGCGHHSLPLPVGAALRIVTMADAVEQGARLSEAPHEAGGADQSNGEQGESDCHFGFLSLGDCVAASVACL